MLAASDKIASTTLVLLPSMILATFAVSALKRSMPHSTILMIRSAEIGS